MFGKSIARYTGMGAAMVAGLVFTMAFGVTPALAVNCVANPNHHDCGGSGGGKGGKKNELLLEGLLVGEFSTEPPSGLPPNACDTNKFTVGPVDDPKVSADLLKEFKRVVKAFGMEEFIPLEDQMIGFGKAAYSHSNNNIQFQLQGSGNGVGAVNRVELPGPGLNCSPDPDDNPKADRGAVWLQIDDSDDICGLDASPCITGYMVWAHLDNNKWTRGNNGKFTVIGPITLPTAPCVREVIDIFDRFKMKQQGKKDVAHGNLTYGALHFWVLPEDQVCPIP